MKTKNWLLMQLGSAALCMLCGCQDMVDTPEVMPLPGPQGPQGEQGPPGDPAAVLGMEIVPVDDARLSYQPSTINCAPGEWCQALDSGSINRLSTNGRFTSCQGEADCSGNRVELTLDNNMHRTVVLAHHDSADSRIIVVELSVDGGATYTFHKAINTHRVRAQAQSTSNIRTLVSNLPMGADVRIRLVAAKGRMNIEGFGLSQLILPESHDKAFRSIARASANGPVDDTCVVGSACGPSPLATRVLTFVKTQDDTDVRVHYIDNMMSSESGGAAHSCDWHIYFDGNPCPDGDIFGTVYARNSTPHRTRSVGGYCSGLAAGSYTVQVYVSNSLDYGANCYTGWPGQRWLLEAEEVQ